MSSEKQWDEEEEGINYFEDAAPTSINEKSLGELATLVLRAKELEGELANLGNFMAEKEEELKRIKRSSIPFIMQSIGLADFSLSDGSKIEVQKKLTASIKADDKPEAFNWLEGHGYGGIIKTEVVAPMGKGSVEEAKKVAEQMRALGVDASVDRSVHHKTLESFVKERLADGESLPECFSVYEFKEAKISAPKKRK